VLGAIAGYIYRLNGKIKEQSIHDPLTGLHNRYYLDEIMSQELERAKRESIPLSIVIIDIDHFKTINDTYGHAAGDEVLKGIATCLIQSVRKNDFLFRYGGEEFVIIIPTISYEQAMQRMETCRQEIQDMQRNYEGAELSVTISAGIAVYSLHGTTQDSLLMAADKALYYSKEHGRNQITLAPLKNSAKESL
jgi:diguanylate cyclase (GGDEF)-like protein